MKPSRTKGEAFSLSSGIPVIVERDDRLPLVDVSIDIRLGKLDDPEGLEGLSRLYAAGLRSGPRGTSELALAGRLDELGARLAVSVAKRAIRLRGAVLSRNAPAFIGLLARLLEAPAFRRAEVERARRRIIAGVETLSDDDRALAHRAFRGIYFRNHPYGRALGGTPSTLANIHLEDLQARSELVRSARMLTIGLAGSLPQDAFRATLEDAFGGFGATPLPTRELAAPRPPRGLRLVIVDKPERTQCQLVLGSRGLRIGDSATIPVHVANHAFGGSFTSTLVHEVRSKRGYSYGAASTVCQGPVRDATLVQTFPNADHAVACAKLVLRLFESFVERGVSKKQLDSAKDALVKGHAFELETAAKRLESRMEVETLGIPPSHHDRFVELVRGVDRETANRAVSSRLSARDMVLVVVGEEARLRKRLERLPDLRETFVFSHRELPTSLTL